MHEDDLIDNVKKKGAVMKHFKNSIVLDRALEKFGAVSFWNDGEHAKHWMAIFGSPCGDIYIPLSYNVPNSLIIISHLEQTFKERNNEN